MPRWAHKIPDQRLWVFTSGENYELALADGSIELLESAGAVILQDTCPEVTPYNRAHYNHLLTNSLKAEHYLTSGLNRLPTSVMPILEGCIAHAFDPDVVGRTSTTFEFRKHNLNTPVRKRTSNRRRRRSDRSSFAESRGLLHHRTGNGNRCSHHLPRVCQPRHRCCRGNRPPTRW